MLSIVRSKFRKFSILFIVALILLMSTTQMFAMDEHETYEHKTYDFSGGDGTKEKPFLISNSEDLIALSDVFSSDNNISNAYFKLTIDIDLGEWVWNPIGTQFTGFKGEFDGNGKKITIRNMADGDNFGLFGVIDSDATIKDLTVTGIINKKINSTKVVCFGLIAAKAEGTIESCKTNGNIVLTIDSTEDIYVGGAVGFGRGSFSNIKNEASINLSGSGKRDISLGGIIGQSHENAKELSYMTNMGTIKGNIDGMIRAGGITGNHGFSPRMYSMLNQGDVLVTVKSLTGNDGSVAAGGITGELRNSDVDRAINKGKVFMSFPMSKKKGKVEAMAGGLIGIGERCKVTNVGNEGNAEGRDGGIHYTAGIIAADGREVYIANVYNKGDIYNSSSIKDAELYTSGIVGNVTAVDNFYNSGSVRLKEGNYKETDGDAFTNIRPGENTKTFNYGYWQTGILAFPLLNKGQPTTSSFNPVNGKLSRNVTVGGKAYNDITEALNGWVDTQKGDYLSWVGQGTPTHRGDGSPGHFLGFRNKRDGKWLNASDWAVEWMDKADKLGIIPKVLLNADMTEGISRKEFSALAVKLYEHLSKETVIADSNSPFRDINDEFVTRAYNLGIVTGTGNGLFAPNDILTREQASTMLARVYKNIYNKPLDIEGVVKFTDDGLISPWAKESVYFMAKQGILNGIGNNIFAPDYKKGESEVYGRATREQAFKIAVAMIELF